jgi:trehalose-phosphatase
MMTLSAFFEQLRLARGRVLMLDYDGTLAPFRVERDLAEPYPGIREVLTRIQATGTTRLVVVSGRPLAELVPLLGLDPVPEVWGSHGWERLRPGAVAESTPLPAEVVADLTAQWSWLQSVGLRERSERKTASIAVHWRGLSSDRIKAIRTQLRARWLPLEGSGTLELLEFDGGMELRATGFHKGKVVESILSEVESDCAVAYLGDDETDEDAFRALAGRGLSLLVRPERRPSAADHWLCPPAELLDFLESWASASAPP